MKKQMKTAILLVLALWLAAGTALAAPARDEQMPDAVGGAQEMLERVLGAAVLRDVPALAAGEVPGQALTEGVMLLQAGADGTEALGYDEMAKIYARYLACGQYEAPEKSTCPCITLTEDGAVFDLELLPQTPRAGVYVYDARETEGGTEYLCDVYSVWAEAPLTHEEWDEVELTWLCHARVTANAAGQAESYELSPYYLDGCFADWQTAVNEEYGWECSIPRILPERTEADGEWTYASADGTARLTVRAAEAVGYDEMLARFMRAPVGDTVTEQREFSWFYASDGTRFVLNVAPENVPWSFEAELVFPAEREREFTLYAEIIRNSFIVWGDSCG